MNMISLVLLLDLINNNKLGLKYSGNLYFIFDYKKEVIYIYTNGQIRNQIVLGTNSLKYFSLIIEIRIVRQG